ncbi:MAG: hypothetical protein BWX87_02574 [Bacteroidetes bacterium ADurb.Bin123]|nr:MAG: hypothetical protein BWX87_02574 [Bacteroidetes bacterium ADurb.Bin123]
MPASLRLLPYYLITISRLRLMMEAEHNFGLTYVKTGLIDKKFGKVYAKLFDMR